MSQGSLNVPTVGPDSPTSFAGQANTALDALVSKNSGSGAPTNFPTTGGSATQGQEWWDTSPGAGIIDDRVHDGSSFLNRGGIDTGGHLWMPKVGGGSSSISGAAGGTVDIGSIRSSYVLLTGTLVGTPITSFGNNALLNTGESKFVEAGAPGILTYNATSLKTPGSVDLPFNVGDTWQQIYLGSGNWRIYDYSRSSGLGKATGEIFMVYGTAAPAGSCRANALTLGDASSGATERANADTVNLWIYLYLQDPNLTVSGGRTAPGNTRATAITDYNLHKTIALPDGRSRMLVALAVMGNADPHRMGGATFLAGNANTLGAAGGEGAHVNLLTEETPHAHPYFGPTSPNASSSTSGGLGVPNATNTTTNKAGGKSVTVTSASPAVATWNAHGFLADQPISFDTDGGSLPTGVTAATTYYVSATGLTTNTFQFSATPGGASVNTSSTGSNLFAWAAHNNMPPFMVGGTLCLAL
jgi:hypothetical protein